MCCPLVAGCRSPQLLMKSANGVWIASKVDTCTFRASTILASGLHGFFSIMVLVRFQTRAHAFLSASSRLCWLYFIPFRYPVMCLQGRLSGSHLKNCAVVCQAVDLALLCKPQQLLSLIGDALTDTEGQQLPEVKRRRGRGKHVHKDSGASSLNVSCHPGSFLLLKSSATICVS